MDFFKNAARNCSIIVTSTLVNSLIAVFIIALVARYLNKDLFGKYIFVITFVGVFEVFTDMGYNTILIREVARAKDRVREMVGLAIMIKLLVAIFSFVLIICGVYLFNLWVNLSLPVMKAICILALAVAIDFIVDVFVSVSRAFERMEYEALLKTFNFLTYLGLVGLVVYIDCGFLYIFVAKLVSNILNSIMATYLCIKRYGRPQFRLCSRLGIYLTREAFPLGIAQVIERLYLRTNLLLIRVIGAVVEVGFYGGAYRIVEQLSMISYAIVTSVFPVLSRYSQDSKLMLQLAYEKTLKLLIILGFPMAVGIGVLADRIAPIVFGKELIEISGCLKILAFVLAFSFPNYLFKFVLSSVNKQTIHRSNVLTCFTINLALALILIPNFGYMGAAYAMTISSFSLFLLGLYTVSKNVVRISLSEIFLKPAMGSIIMGIFLFLMGNISLLLVIPSGMAIYFAILIFFKTFSREDIILLKEVMPYGTGKAGF